MEPCSKESVLTTLQVRQAEIQGQIGSVATDVAYVKKRIENGISTKIDSMHEVVTRLQPIIDHHAKVVNNIEMMGWWISRSLLAVILGVVVWAIGKGFVPSI